MQTRTPRHSESMGVAGRVALARSYLLGWFHAFSCYLQLHGLSVLFSYLIFMWAAYVGEPVAPAAGPRGRGACAARGGAEARSAAAGWRLLPARALRMNGDGDTYI